MVTIFHGDNTSASREAFISQKQNAPDHISLRAGEFSITDLLQAFQGSKLFSQTTTVFIENLLTKTKAEKELDAIANCIVDNDAASTFLWEAADVSRKITSLFPKAKIQLFRLPSSLFQFVDSLGLKQQDELIKLFHQTLESTDVVIIVAMLQRQIRLLLGVKEQAEIDEVKKLAPWQKSKLERQVNAFSRYALLKLHEKLFRLDFNQKTGESALPLTTSIDFFLLSLYH